MAITNGYFTLDAFKTRFWNSTPSTDAERDAQIELAIEGASRWIDNWCGRRIYAASETRYFTPEWGDLLFVSDLLSISTLKTDDDNDRVYETTWASTDYDLEPENAAYMVPPQPYNMIRVTDNGDYAFPRGVRRGVEIVGSFGFASTTPKDIGEACYLLSARLWKRKDAIFGVSGNAQLGEVVQAVPEDKEAISLLKPYIWSLP